jgi:hypothetical protein
LVKKVLDHPVLAGFEELIQRNPFGPWILVKLMTGRELCLLYPIKAFGEIE